jgi:hypothetical protein
MNRCLRILLITAVLSVEMSVGDFVELQGLSDRERSTRLLLPESCVPRMTAMRSGGHDADRVKVEVRCLKPAQPGGATQVGTRRASARN